MKYFLVIAVFLCNSYYGISQTATINYGNNPNAGKYYAVRGIHIYCEIYGKGKPLLMIHGNGGNISAFSKNIGYFSKQYKVIAVDSRAQGKTTDNKDSLSFEMMADDFDALLTTLHIDSAYVLGWSDGGINAIEMAMRHPGKVIKFASTGANVTTDSAAFAPGFWRELEQYYTANRNKTFATAKEKNDWKLFMLDWLQPNISMQSLQTIKCPALIISGDKDLIAPGHSMYIYQNIPRAQLWILPNSSHSTLIDHADEFNRKVDEFFRQ